MKRMLLPIQALGGDEPQIQGVAAAARRDQLQLRGYEAGLARVFAG